MIAEPEDIVAFWFDEVGPAGWYGGGPELDARCRERFLATWEAGRTGALDAWTRAPGWCLALILLFDQLPRNMFRGEARAFATDARALAAAKGAIDRGFDLRLREERRPLFYMPLIHSELLADQERAVRLCALRLADPAQLRHARAHRAIIRRFGRFPFRNAALGRPTTPQEAAFLADGGYAAAYAEVA
jgi:uncharacterized protein (DUF924 family)